MFKNISSIPSLIVVFISGILLVSCGGDNKEESNDSNQSNNANYGGSFHIADNDPFETLNPRNIRSLNAANVAGQIFEGLLTLNPSSLEIEEGLAKEWKSNENQTVFEFTLNPDAKFQSSNLFGGKSRNVKAEDISATIHYYCGGESESPAYISAYKGVLKGADEYHNGEAKTISGIETTENSVKLTLVEPRSTFLYSMATVSGYILPKELIENADEEFVPVGSGPFMPAKEQKNNKAFALVKNPDYYNKDSEGNALPYLDSVVIHFINSRHDQLKMFEEGNLSIINGLPTTKIKKVVMENIEDFNGVPPKYKLHFDPEMITQYYEFNMTRPHFQDVKVRQAIAYAIDRNKIIDKVLKQQAFEPGVYGFTPPLRDLRGYDFEAIKESSYSYDPEKAKQLMAEAGYPDGKGFPTITLEYNINPLHSRVASEVQRQLENNLGVKLSIDGVSFSQKMDDAAMAKNDIFRSAWVADYPSPETFLKNAYGKNVPESIETPSELNTMRYNNPEFDDYFEKGMSASSLEEQYKYFAEAEKILMKDAPMIPLWYAANYKIQWSNVRNLNFNSIQMLDLKSVYLKEWTKEEYEAATTKK